MLKNNLTIGESLRKTGREEQILKSIIYNTIIEEYKKEKKIDISKYLVSIKISKNGVTIKTNKPLINSELLIIESNAILSIKEKIKKIGINYSDLYFKYV